MPDQSVRPDRRLLCLPLCGLLLMLGVLGVLGGRLPHSQHRPTPVVQRAAIGGDFVTAAVGPEPVLEFETLMAPAAHRVPPDAPRVILQPQLASATLQTRAP